MKWKLQQYKQADENTSKENDCNDNHIFWHRIMIRQAEKTFIMVAMEKKINGGKAYYYFCRQGFKEILFYIILC